MIVFYHPEEKVSHSLRIISRPGHISTVFPKTTVHVVAFSDLNGDLDWQEGEPYSFVERNEFELNENRLLVLQPQEVGPILPANLRAYLDLIPVKLGAIVDIDDPIIGEKIGKAGLFEPLTSLQTGKMGYYFLQPYDGDKQVIFMVHGMSGYPAQFKHIISHIDRQRFQVLLLAYPSGFPLEQLSSGIENAMNILQHRYEFERVHVIAHSMGGLITRRWLQRCQESQRCPLLGEYITVSTPWLGHEAAATGAKMSSPKVWKDMSPGSEFLQRINSIEKRIRVPHTLVFSYQSTGVMNTEANDGSVTLASQLSYPIQKQVNQQLGIRESHVGVLSNTELFELINRRLFIY
ncbi:alpha/beta hydrolase [Aestuariirhabdus haliotis]|uniref:alpha/beta hydrolase n=1 Tax=Aestuariirhabdus haliotis TaxID=2918751 RepID=UPI0020C10D1C|nr:alpha/beta hydrolase [Aestuariirhabdus haliotis]MCL6418150.1 alpha/beta hydrolase [Aestuariirhabdus haliotis]